MDAGAGGAGGTAGAGGADGAAAGAVAAPGGSDVVQLDVGGVAYRTTRATLCTDACSMLTAMFERRSQPTGEGATVFIDRDGARFRHVLNWLRNGTVHCGGDAQALGELLEEAECECRKRFASGANLQERVCAPRSADAPPRWTDFALQGLADTVREQLRVLEEEYEHEQLRYQEQQQQQQQLLQSHETAVAMMTPMGARTPQSLSLPESLAQALSAAGPQTPMHQRAMRAAVDAYNSVATGGSLADGDVLSPTGKRPLTLTPTAFSRGGMDF